MPELELFYKIYQIKKNVALCQMPPNTLAKEPYNDNNNNKLDKYRQTGHLRGGPKGLFSPLSR